MELRPKSLAGPGFPCCRKVWWGAWFKLAWFSRGGRRNPVKQRDKGKGLWGDCAAVQDYCENLHGSAQQDTHTLLKIFFTCHY